MKIPDNILGQFEDNWRQNKIPKTFKVIYRSALIISIVAFIIFLVFHDQLTVWLETQHHHTLFDIISLISSSAFALLGFIISYLAIKDGERQENEIERQRKNLAKTTKHLDRISKQMSTRYIELFPNHLNDIINLIKGMRKSFYIVADCADYGSFSNPEGQKKMVQAIQEICKNYSERDDDPLEIEIRICGKFQLISRSSEFWEKWQAAQASPAAWKSLLVDKKFQGRLKTFLRFNTELQLDQDKCSIDDFKGIMTKRHEDVIIELENCGKMVKVTPLPNLENDMPGIFFWMKDVEDLKFGMIIA